MLMGGALPIPEIPAILNNLAADCYTHFNI